MAQNYVTISHKLAKWAACQTVIKTYFHFPPKVVVLYVNSSFLYIAMAYKNRIAVLPLRFTTDYII